PALRVVGKIKVELLADARLQRRVEDREHDLDAAEEVAVHPVGARAVELVGTAVQEPVAAALLEETPHDRAHVDVLGDARNAGPQAADAAHDQVDADARAGSLVQRADDLGLYERIQLRDDVALAAARGVACFAAYEPEQALLQIERRL